MVRLSTGRFGDNLDRIAVGVAFLPVLLVVIGQQDRTAIQDRQQLRRGGRQPGIGFLHLRGHVFVRVEELVAFGIENLESREVDARLVATLHRVGVVLVSPGTGRMAGQRGCLVGHAGRMDVVGLRRHEAFGFSQGRPADGQGFLDLVVAGLVQLAELQRGPDVFEGLQ